jgi:hypothetical protein
MTSLAGPLHLLAAVLLVSGIGKLVSPRPAADAMGDAGLPLPFRGATNGIALGAVELTVGLVAVAVPAWWAAVALGTFYGALAAFVVRLRRADSTAGCGCFGASSTPPGTAHLVLNVAAALTAFAVAVVGVPDIVDVFDEGLGVAVPYVLLLAVGACVLLAAPALTADLAQLRAGDGHRSFGPVTAVTGARR